jgi:hypothetical protein
VDEEIGMARKPAEYDRCAYGHTNVVDEEVRCDGLQPVLKCPLECKEANLESNAVANIDEVAVV